ncbi:MAG: tetratricopeptide repeat protein [Verrucomicrobia bacterium]|nr:tetratricopeptide repeat protein [Verrucomicrobiota bacterium]
MKSAAADPFSQGVLEEEGNLDLDAAMASYQSLIQEFDRQRPQVANAIFRLGEVYRKTGRLQEAKIQYARILREFPDQAELTRLSHARILADLEPPAATGLSSGTQYRQRLQQVVTRAPGSTSQAGTTSSPYGGPTSAGGYAARGSFGQGGGLGAGGVGFGGGGRFGAGFGGGGGGVGGLGGAPGTGLSTMSVPGYGPSPSNTLGPAALSPEQEAANARQKELLLAEIKLVEQAQGIAKKKQEVGAISPEEIIPIEREVLSLQREVSALDGNRAQEKELLQAEMKLVEQQQEIIKSKSKSGKAGTEDLIKAERELLGLRRKLAALDMPQATPSQTTSLTAPRSDPNVQKPFEPPVETQEHPPFSALWAASARPPGNKSFKQRDDARRQSTQVKAELATAEIEARSARHLLGAVQNSAPELLPSAASADPRYQELKKAYQDAVVGGPESAVKPNRDKLTTWVEKIYIPELKSQVESAHRKVDGLQSELVVWGNEMDAIGKRENEDAADYRAILNNLYTIYVAKEKWARAQKKQPGAAVSENDLGAYLRTGLPKPVAGETYQINPVGSLPTAKLAKPLGDFTAGHLIEAPIPPTQK